MATNSDSSQSAHDLSENRASEQSSNQAIGRLKSELLQTLFPSRCALCGALGECPCLVCGGQFERHDAGVEFSRSGVLAFRASVFLYRGICADAVQALKYERRTSLVDWMAAEIATAKERFGFDCDAVVPVPIHWSRRAQRGFNQAELLSERLSPRLDLLARIRRTRPQVGLSRSDRLTNLMGAFQAAETVAGKRILLIDDVLTSGGTAKACAAALAEKGAAEVGILSFAGEPFV